jgi:hypothetical protein
MIPTLILLGVLLGRWYRWVLVGAVVGWPALLVVDGVLVWGWVLLGASAVAAVNTGVGVLAYQGIRRVVQPVRHGVDA